MRRIKRKSEFRLCENKGANQLCSIFTSDQRISSRYTGSTISFYNHTQNFIYLAFVCVYRPVCVGPGRKSQRMVFSRRGSYALNTKPEQERCAARIMTVLTIGKLHVFFHVFLNRQNGTSVFFFFFFFFFFFIIIIIKLSGLNTIKLVMRIKKHH